MPAEPLVIETPRLRLRRMMRYDAPGLHAMFADAETMRYWSAMPHAVLGETETFVAESLAAMRRGDAHDFVVLHQSRVIGRVAFWMANEVGFVFHRAHWGRGFAREAVRALLGHGFDALGFRSARADVDPDNARSLKLLERLGFQRTGYAERTYQLGDRWTDSVYLELDAETFRRGG